MRAVVVGASSGLGRCIARIWAHGDSVALLARRKDRLEEAAEEAGGLAVAIECDVTDERSCRAATMAASSLGGIDAIVYATGVGTLRRLADTDAETWRWLFDTNVTGAALVTAAAIEHLAASKGAAAYLSSVQSGQTPPWPGLGAYAASKAALDKMIEAWSIEYPTVGFTRVVVGECGGGEGDAGVGFSSDFDRELMMELAPIWMQRNYMCGTLMEVDELIKVVDTVLRCGGTASIPSVHGDAPSADLSDSGDRGQRVARHQSALMTPTSRRSAATR